MDKRIRTEITFETDRTFVITRRPKPLQNWCPDCALPSKMIPAEEAGRATGLTSRAVYRALETGQVHFIEECSGMVLFCLNSLSLLTSDAYSTGTGVGALPLIAAQATDTNPEADQPIETSKVRDTSTYDDAAKIALTSDRAVARDQKGRKSDWVLTAGAFENLLDRLDEDRDRAGKAYEEIRHRIMKFFALRRCESPEELADLTIDRVARRISEGKEIWTTNPANYFYGVARNVSREYWDSKKRVGSYIDSFAPLAESCNRQTVLTASESGWPLELVFQALENSMATLSPENRELILEYYQGEKGDKIRNRQSIAKRLGIPPNALRIRVHRIREKLERSVRDYMRNQVK